MGFAKGSTHPTSFLQAKSAKKRSECKEKDRKVSHAQKIDQREDISPRELFPKNFVDIAKGLHSSDVAHVLQRNPTKMDAVKARIDSGQEEKEYRKQAPSLLLPISADRQST
jgi:hypothetical protein